MQRKRTWQPKPAKAGGEENRVCARLPWHLHSSTHQVLPCQALGWGVGPGVNNALNWWGTLRSQRSVRDKSGHCRNLKQQGLTLGLTVLELAGQGLIGRPRAPGSWSGEDPRGSPGLDRWGWGGGRQQGAAAQGKRSHQFSAPHHAAGLG